MIFDKVKIIWKSLSTLHFCKKVHKWNERRLYWGWVGTRKTFLTLKSLNNLGVSTIKVSKLIKYVVRNSLYLTFQLYSHQNYLIIYWLHPTRYVCGTLQLWLWLWLVWGGGGGGGVSMCVNPPNDGLPQMFTE